MTREVLKENWHIIEAFKNGAEIQYLDYNETWRDTDNIEYIQKVKHRIKSKPEYIPFDYSDAEYLILKSVRNKDEIDSYISIILSVDIGGVTLPGRYLIYDSLFKDYTFIDGSPCGKLKQQL